jgi:EmrB/QacA subfamily drug resistance transporter
MHSLAYPDPHDHSPAERWLALGAVMLVLLLSALDNTIVSTAMPRIVAELSGLDRIAWVGTAYLLTSTVVVPIYGKLGDMYGRRPILIFGVIVFLIGSALCGLAGEFGRLPVLGDAMTQLIVFRAVQGIGGGALATGAFATVADLIPPNERGRYTGLFGAVFGLASVIGPLVGGLLTDHATMVLGGHQISGWRFIFYVNLPLGALALYVLVTHLPQLGMRSRGRIDWTGGAMILVAFVPLLLALSWGGHRYPWLAPQMGTMLAISLCGFVALYLVERNNDHAIIPLDLFGNRVFALSNTALFLVNMAFMGVVMFYPLYLQVVRGMPATSSGFGLLPLMGGILVSSMVCGRLSSRYHVVKPFLVGGGALLLLGIVLLLQVDRTTPQWGLSWRLALLGLGMGPTQGMFTLAIQSAVETSRIGVATAAAQFYRQIGATVGVALFGALLTNGLVAELPKRAPEVVSVTAQSVTGVDISHAQRLVMDRPALVVELARNGVPATEIDRISGALKDSFGAAILSLFRVSLGLLALAFVAIVLMPAVRLVGRKPASPAVRRPDV